MSLHTRIAEIRAESGAEQFAFDGCHKIYLIQDEADREEARECGYDILNIDRLESAFEHSCSLRFIHDWKLKKTYIEQFEFEEEDMDVDKLGE